VVADFLGPFPGRATDAQLSWPSTGQAAQPRIGRL